MKRFSLSLVLLVVTLLFCVAGITAKPTNLSFAHAVAETHPQHVWAVKFGKLVEEKSEGSLNIRIFPNAQLGTEQETIEGMKMGSVDIVSAGAGTVYSNWISAMAAFDLPFIFRDYDHLYTVQDGEAGEYIADLLKKEGFQLLGWSDIGWRHFTSNTRPYRTPADMKGLKVRVPQSAVYIEMVKSLGGLPTPVPYAELYLALQQGLADGEENAASSIRAGKFYEVQKYLNLDAHVPVTCAVTINQRKFNGLSAKQQKALIEAGKEATKIMRPYVRDDEEKALQFLEEQGMVLVEVERDLFIEATKNIPDNMSDIPQEIVRMIRETK